MIYVLCKGPKEIIYWTKQSFRKALADRIGWWAADLQMKEMFSYAKESLFLYNSVIFFRRDYLHLILRKTGFTQWRIRKEVARRMAKGWPE